MIIYPTYSPEEIAKESAGIEAAGQRIRSSPALRQEFLRSLGFGPLLDERDRKEQQRNLKSKALGQRTKKS
ncbi:MAG: hypothetical protein ACKVY0_09160 [Prosthecobacter sp.]|uniref:hypothetical protein n=1 Tax=Prosthecobacter sp. TaxID=1965333 RepID=UPI0038FE1EFF